jgi:transforming growth factor-beta-induced protein
MRYFLIKNLIMKKSPILWMLVAAMSVFTFVACDDDDDMKDADTDRSVVEIAQDNPQLTTLVDALSRVNLVDALNGDGPFTIFAPTNTAFDRLGVDLSTISDEDLSEILLYHVFGGEAIQASDLASGQTYLNTAANTSPNGNNLSLLAVGDNGAVTLNGFATVISADVNGRNGVVHVIDQVLQPLDVVGHAAANSNFSELVTALGTASGDLIPTLSGDGPFTVFAPVNSAFEAISSTVAGLTPEELSAILTYHVASGNVRSNELSDGMIVNTVNGATFTINLSGSPTITDGAGNTVNIIFTDVQATNGIVHVIDGVLLPE